MARNEILIGVSNDAVFDVLSDPRSYGHWVVGSSEIRGAEDAWPKIGTKFHHKVGWGPFKIADHTTVVERFGSTRLVLKAKARPLGTAIVELELFPEPGGITKVVMTERAGDPLTRLVFNPLTDRLVKLRNVESLRRLKALAEGRGPSMSEAATP